MKHSMKLKEEPFALIKQGVKSIELRLYDEKRRQIAANDEIEFVKTTDENARIRCTVVGWHVFPSFEELYRHLPLLKCGYTVDNVDRADPSDMNAYYSAEEQREYRVVGIELRLL